MKDRKMDGSHPSSRRLARNQIVGPLQRLLSSEADKPLFCSNIIPDMTGYRLQGLTADLSNE